MSNDLGLGELIPDPNAKRDAVHVAVVPALAGRDLAPGERVGVRERGGAVVAHTNYLPTIGIVDPFLEEGPLQNERFWLWLTPGSVTGLRHVYSHPLLPDEVLGHPGVKEGHAGGGGEIALFQAPEHAPWMTAEIAGLMSQVRGGDLGVLPILADALQDSGEVGPDMVWFLRQKVTLHEAWRLLALAEGGEKLKAVTVLMDVVAEINTHYREEGGYQTDVLTYESLMLGLDANLKDGEEFGLPMNPPDLIDDEEAMKRMWEAYALVTGREVGSPDVEPFFCDCG